MTKDFCSPIILVGSWRLPWQLALRKHGHCTDSMLPSVKIRTRCLSLVHGLTLFFRVSLLKTVAEVSRNK